MISSAGFAAMAQRLTEISQEFCPGRVVASLEGGYNQPPWAVRWWRCWGPWPDCARRMN